MPSKLLSQPVLADHLSQTRDCADCWTDADPRHGMSWVMNQSHVVTKNHGRDSTNGAQNDASHENCSAGMPIFATLFDKQCGVSIKEDDQH